MLTTTTLAVFVLAHFIVDVIKVLVADREETERCRSGEDGPDEAGLRQQGFSDCPQQHRAKVEKHRVVRAVHDAVVERCRLQVSAEINVKAGSDMRVEQQAVCNSYTVVGVKPR